MKYTFVLLLTISMSCGFTSKNETSDIWPNGEWKRHTIDDSSQGGDGFIDVVSNCERGTNAIFVHWSPKDKDQLLDPAAWKTEEFPVASGLGAWMYGIAMQLDNKYGVDMVAGCKDGYITWFESPENPRDLENWKVHPLIPTSWTMTLSPSDIDKDGDLDVVATEAKWTPTSISGPEGYINDLIQIVDLDGDGDLDVVTVEEKGPYIARGEQLKELGVIWYENPARN